MISNKVTLLFFSLLISTYSLQSTANGEPLPISPSRSAHEMQDLHKILADVLTDISSNRRFNTPEVQFRVESNAKKLFDLAHSLNKKNMSSLDLDPTVKIFSGLFQEQTKLAYVAFQTGHRTHARGILAGISGYCIACHTRNETGPSYSISPTLPRSSELTLFEMGEFFAATRQFDKALEAFQRIIEDPTSIAQRPFDWDQSIQYALPIAVRVKRDPDLSLGLVNKMISSKNIPYIFKENAIQWKKSIQQWKEETPRRFKTEEELYGEAQRLVLLAHQTQKYLSDHSADVTYLRATAALHELLQLAPEGKYSSDALLLAGVSYQALDLGFIDHHHEIFYEACLRRAPHTPTAKLCYDRYRQSVLSSYSEDTRSAPPSELKRKLTELQGLSLPERSRTPN